MKNTLRRIGSVQKRGGNIWIDERIVLQGHAAVREVDKRRGQTDRLAFTFRDPIDRFISGFYCRQRMGLPDHHAIWDAAEAVTYSHFETANALAETLYHDDYVMRARAEFGMHAIRHIRRGYVFHFGPIGEFTFGLLPRVVACIDVKDLTTRGPQFFKKLGYDQNADVAASKGTGQYAKDLSPLARSNLENFLKPEYDYYNMFREIQASLLD